MNAVACPNCVAEGVDCPLVIDGECIHCGHPDAPIARRLGDAAFRVRVTSDSLRWRLRGVRTPLRVRAIVARMLRRTG